MSAAGVPNILLAQQDPEFRMTLEKYSRQAGWRYDSVGDGNAVLRAISSKKYDAVIAHYKMPDLGGVALLRAIRSMRPAQAVIMVAAENSVDEAVSALREGGADYLLKPVDYDALLGAVQRAVSGRQRHEEASPLFAFVDSQTTCFTFTTKDAAGGWPRLLIADELLRSKRITLETKLRLELAFQEALANSLEHGNLELASEWKEQYDAEGIDRFSREKRLRLQDPRYAERKLRILSRYRKGRLTIVIEDQGPGFLAEEHLKRSVVLDGIVCHGRGVAIISAVMDEVRYSKRGSRLKMVKYL